MKSLKAYTNSVANQWRFARAWMVVAGLLALLVVYLAGALVANAGSQPSLLVPYDLATADGPVEVGIDRFTDERYLEIVARADLGLYTNWTPGTVANSHRRFQNRLTPKLYAQAASDIEADIPARTEGERAQSLTITELGREMENNRIRIRGDLAIWEGRERIDTRSMEYRLTYQFDGGVPQLAAFHEEEI